MNTLYDHWLLLREGGFYHWHVGYSLEIYFLAEKYGLRFQDFGTILTEYALRHESLGKD